MLGSDGSWLHRSIFKRDLKMPFGSRLLHIVAGLTIVIGSMITTVCVAGTLEDVRAKGKLICGVSEGLPGFSERSKSGAWRGFDVDFCKAVAAAALGRDAKVDYVPLSAEARFDALKSGRIDLLSRNSTWTMSRDLGLGIEFAGISYFDGQGFLVPALFGATSPLQLDGARICVVSGTTSEENASAFFQNKKLKATFARFAKRAEARSAYSAQKCDVLTGDRSALAAERSLLKNPQDHSILRDVISKEPLGPATREDDRKWIGLVRWTLFALINAEELGLTSASIATSGRQQALAMGAPAAKALGLADDWMVSVIGKVGNYAEIFNRNLGQDTSLELSRGINALWNQGGLLYAPPMH